MLSLKKEAPTAPASILDLLAGRPTGALDQETVRYALANEIASLVACERHVAEQLGTSPELAHLYARFMREQNLRNRIAEAAAATVSLARDCNVPVGIFKGVVLAQQAYRNPSARASNDLDILIGECSPRDLEELLRRLGRTKSSATALATLRERGEPVHEISGRINGVDVDIHFNPFGLISPLRAPSDTWLAASSHTAWFEGIAIPSPSPEAHLLICLINLIRRGGGALRFYGDAARLIQSGVDWAEFWRLSRLEGLSILAEQALLAVRRDLGTQIPLGTGTPKWWGPTLGEPPAGDSLSRRGPLHVLRLSPAKASDARRLFRWYAPTRLQRAARTSHPH